VSKQLFAVNGIRDLIFINPTNVTCIMKSSELKTTIFCNNGITIDTKDDIRDVVDRYQSALCKSMGHGNIVDQMNEYTRKGERHES
jgi:hypothetical protein